MIRCKMLFLLLTAVWLSTSGCRTENRNQLTQIAVIDSLMAGVYDGSATLGELKRHGDFGIGTFDKLDGEMLLLDGTIYQIRSDGSVHTPPDAITTPFASVLGFHPVRTEHLPKRMTYAELCTHLDNLAANANIPFAIRIRGRFAKVHTRSVPAQSKPYPPLFEVARHQPEFQLENVSGDLAGFRLPPFVKGLNVPGWHLHFLTDDRTAGGHVLGLELIDGTVELAPVYDWRIRLPQSDSGFAGADLTRDRTGELRAVEQINPGGKGGF